MVIQKGLAARQFISGSRALLSRGKVSGAEAHLAPQLGSPDWTVKVSWQLDPNRGPCFLFRLESFRYPMVPPDGTAWMDGRRALFLSPHFQRNAVL